MKTLRTLLATVFLVAFGHACGGTADENGGVKTGNGATIVVQAVSNPTGTPIVAAGAMSAKSAVEPRDVEDPDGEDSSGAILTVEIGFANIEFVEIELPDGLSCADYGNNYLFVPPVSCTSDKIRVQGPFLVDLINGSSIPETGELTIPAGTYKKVTIRFGESDGLNLPPGHALEGHTLFASGYIQIPNGTPETTDDPVYDFVMPFDFDVEPEFDNAAGINISDTALDRILLNLDVNGWFFDLPIGDCIEDLDPIVEPINFASDLHGDCEDVEEELQENIEQSGDLEHENEEDDD